MTYINPEDILKSLPSLYYVIDIKSKAIIQTNDTAIKDKEGTCYKSIFGKNKPCHNIDGLCICQQFITKNKKAEFTIEKGEGSQKEFFKISTNKINDNLVIINSINISDHAFTRKELKINRKRLERAEKLAAFGYWEFNVDEKVITASAGALEIYGLNDSEIPLEKVQKIPLPEYRMEMDKRLSDLINKKKPYNVHFKIKHPSDNEIRHIHSIAEFREDKNMVFGVIHDITETIVAHETVQENEEYLRLLFENMNSGFAYHQIVTDSKGNPIDYIFLDVNPKFEEFTGLKRGNIINKTVREVFPGTESHWITRYGNVALTGNPISFTDYSGYLGKHFEISAFSPREGYFAVSFHDVTEKYKSELDLKETLLDLKLAEYFARIGNWKFDPRTNNFIWSDNVFVIFERQQKEGSISFNELKEYTPEHYEILHQSMQLAIHKGISFEMLLKLKLPNNKTKWIEMICQPDDAEKEGGYFLRGSIQDITESIKNQEELDKSNKLLRTVIDNIPDGIYMKDTNYIKVITNKGDVKNCGANSVSELIGKTDFDFFPKEIAQVFYEDDRQVIEEGKSIINREEIIPDNGNIKWILTSKFPFENEKGEILGLVGTGRDITSEKEQKTQLRLLNQTVEQSPLSVVITDQNGRIEYVNQGFVNRTGYSFKEAIGQSPSILKSEEQDEVYYKNLWETISAGDNWYGEFHNKRKDGTLFWESAVITPILDENHKIRHFVAIKEDITEKTQMIADLKKAKEQAIESDRLKTLFLANMSHEIRTPLNGILGFSSIICAGDTDPDQLEYYGQIIENSGRRLITVIDDIIDISMIQSNQLKIDFEKFEINELLQEIFVVYHTQNAEKLNNIEFKIEYCEDLDLNVIYSDKNRIYQILKNLLDNAFKFTMSGSIEFGCKSVNKEELVLFVEDSGVGVDKSKQKIIFDTFRQAEEGNSRKFDGSGLGLAIITGILERLNGAIKLESEPGVGSTFYVTIPRNEQTEKLEVEEKNIKPKKTGRIIMAKRIVSFEDDSSSIEYLKTVVGMLGYNLVNFVYAKEGIEYIRNNKVDMVLMDVQLPEMNGYEATKLIKAEFPDLPVLIQTAFAMTGDMEKAFDAGCDDYLSKPLSIEALKGKIKKYIEMAE